MFCRFCGNEINDDAQFCPKCGNAKDGSQITVKSSAAPAFSGRSDRETLITQMDSSFEVMTAMKRAEDAIEQLDEQMEPVRAKAANGRRNLIAASGILLWFVGIVLTIPLAIALQKKHQAELAELEQQQQAKQNEIETLKNDASLAWLPYDYRDPTYFAMMYGYVKNMRANSLSEAINLLETEMHQARVELMSSVAAQASMDAASSAKTATGAATAAAFFSLFR